MSDKPSDDDAGVMFIERVLIRDSQNGDIITNVKGTQNKEPDVDERKK